MPLTHSSCEVLEDRIVFAAGVWGVWDAQCGEVVLCVRGGDCGRAAATCFSKMADWQTRIQGQQNQAVCHLCSPSGVVSGSSGKLR